MLSKFTAAHTWISDLRK